MMKRHCSSSFDRISELPCHIKQTILIYLPLEDMARTSILSKNWRLQWTKVPHLIFDRRKSFTVDYVVPSSIFACVGLKHLILSWCIFKPAVTFHGFSKLVTLELLEVEMDSNVSISSCPLLESLTMEVLNHVVQFSIDAPKLVVFSFRGTISNIGFMNTPLLKVLSFNGDEEAFDGVSAFDLMKLLCSLPLLEDLLLFYKFLKLLAVHVFSDRLPTVLNNLKKLELRCVSLNVADELSSTLRLLRNSPNLQKFKLQLSFEPNLEFSSNMQVYSDIYLTKLEEVKVDLFGLGWPDVEFFKFLLAVSPVLQKLCIDGSSSLDESESNMVVELISYPRASRKAEIVFH